MVLFWFGFLFVISFVHEAELVSTCGYDEFPCNDGSCIERIRWCDSKSDCDDDTDELYCFFKSSLIGNPNRCNETLFFLCDNGQCIPATGRCDVFSSCSDNSDEENCDATSVVSINFTKPAIKVDDSKKFVKAYDHENWMKVDHVPNADINILTTSVYTTDWPTDSEHISSNVNLNQGDQHKAHQVDSSTDISNFISENVTHEDLVKPMKPKARRKAFEFRDMLLLNKSRSEQKVAVNSVISKEKDLFQGYTNLSSDSLQKAKERAIQWLLDARDSDYGWGEETARGMIALMMADYSREKTDFQLMSKQLHLKLFTLMSRNETNPIPLADLALYINALSASCDNPRNFHGHDLVGILRDRTNAAQEWLEFVTPFVYLVLCLNNVTSNEDAVDMFYMVHEIVPATDMVDVLTLAGICMSRIPEFSHYELEKIAVSDLYDILLMGLSRNIYDQALEFQATDASAEIDKNYWNRTEALRRITEKQNNDGSFGDILSTYYAVPTLSGRSFLWISEVCPGKPGLGPMEVLKNSQNKKRYVDCSLRFGNPLEMSLSLLVKVQMNASFMDIMEIAAATNPSYKFQYDIKEDKAIVYSIGGIANDAERGLYWEPYTSQRKNNNKNLKPFKGDIRNFIPAHGEDVAFWRTSISF